MRLKKLFSSRSAYGERRIVLTAVTDFKSPKQKMRYTLSFDDSGFEDTRNVLKVERNELLIA